MSDFIENLPVNNKDYPTSQEYVILDTYFNEDTNTNKL